MPKGTCPLCDQLENISPTPIPVTKDSDGNPSGSSCRWRVDLHPVKGTGKLCDGSGSLI